MNLTNVVYVLMFSNLLLINCSNMVDFTFNIINKNKYSAEELQKPLNSTVTTKPTTTTTTTTKPAPTSTSPKAVQTTTNPAKGAPVNNTQATAKAAKPVAKTSSVQLNVTAISKIPVIAILSYQGKNASVSQVDSSYVSWLVSGGNDVAFISQWMNDTEIDSILANSNGLLIPGFTSELEEAQVNSPKEKFVTKVLQKTINMNKKNNYFPVLSICQGSIIVQTYFAKSYNILKKYDGVNGVMSKVTALDDRKKIQSLMMFSRRHFTAFTTRQSTVHFVRTAVDPSFYISNKNLNLTLKATGYSTDVKGNKYVAMFEAIGLPIYGLQFHPEKVIYDRKYKFVSRSDDSIEVSQKFLDFFTLTARLNKNSNRPEILKNKISEIKGCNDKEGLYQFVKNIDIKNIPRSNVTLVGKTVKPQPLIKSPTTKPAATKPVATKPVAKNSTVLQTSVSQTTQNKTITTTTTTNALKLNTTLTNSTKVSGVKPTTMKRAKTISSWNYYDNKEDYGRVKMLRNPYASNTEYYYGYQ
jgi:gamma-glutamyl hydrolase